MRHGKNKCETGVQPLLWSHKGGFKYETDYLRLNVSIWTRVTTSIWYNEPVTESISYNILSERQNFDDYPLMFSQSAAFKTLGINPNTIKVNDFSNASWQTHASFALD